MNQKILQPNLYGTAEVTECNSLQISTLYYVHVGTRVAFATEYPLYLTVKP